jgi:hypothetical protein
MINRFRLFMILLICSTASVAGQMKSSEGSKMTNVQQGAFDDES